MSRTTELGDDNSLVALQFLAALVCRADKSLIEERWAALRSPGARSRVAELASRFSIEPAVSSWLSSRPDALRDEAARRVIVTALRNSPFSDAAVALLRLLVSAPAAKGLLPIVVKGAALRIGGWYATERYFVDVDVVVREPEVERWIAAASEVGAEVRRASPGAYEAAYVLHRGGLLEIHLALAGWGGSDWGPRYPELVAKCTRVTVGDREVAIPLPGVAREIAVHHFVFHHDGEPLHAMRTLQDLAVLENERDETTLDWGSSSPAGAVAKLRRVVRQVRAGGGADSDEFLESLAAVLATEDPATRFADSVDGWIESRRAAGKSAPRLILQRVFPPWTAMQEGSEPLWLTASRYLTRPPRLVGRYLAARRRRNASLDSARTRWLETLTR